MKMGEHGFDIVRIPCGRPCVGKFPRLDLHLSSPSEAVTLPPVVPSIE
jgi:hypothetical protein